MFKAKFGLSDLLKDKITGFEGIVMGISFYTTGCTHYGLLRQAVNDKGSTPNWEWLDETRLDCVREKAVSLNARISQKSVGGPAPSAPEM